MRKLFINNSKYTVGTRSVITKFLFSIKVPSSLDIRLLFLYV